MGRRGTGRGSGRGSIVAAVGVGYLLGSVPFADLAAVLASRGTATRIDLRSAGSGPPAPLSRRGGRWRRAGVGERGRGNFLENL